MSDVVYLKINLYLRMFHPLSTTGLLPILILLILNVRISKGIKDLQVSPQLFLAFSTSKIGTVKSYHPNLVEFYLILKRTYVHKKVAFILLGEKKIRPKGRGTTSEQK